MPRQRIVDRMKRIFYWPLLVAAATLLQPPAQDHAAETRARSMAQSAHSLRPTLLRRMLACGCSQMADRRSMQPLRCKWYLASSSRRSSAKSAAVPSPSIATRRKQEPGPSTGWPDLRQVPTPAVGAASGFSHSGAAVGTPGALRMLELMHRRYGRLPWGTLLGNAIELADTGFPVSPYLARSIAAAYRSGMPLPAWLADAAGKPVAEGASVRNAELAETLRRIAARGPAAIYINSAGAISDVAQNTSPAGRLIPDDIRGYQAVEREPVCISIRQQKLCSFPPPSYGGVTILEMLEILDHRTTIAPSFLNLGFVHRFVEAGRLAEADRMSLVGDADAGIPSAGKLLDHGFVASRASLIRNNLALANPIVGGVPHDVSPSRLRATPACAGALHEPGVDRRCLGERACNDDDDQR